MSAMSGDLIPQSPRKRGRRKRAKPPAQPSGRKFLPPIENLLAQIPNEPAHGNQQVFLQHLLVAHLLAFFNPTARSLRMIEDLSATPVGQEFIGLERLPKSTLADAQNLCDPTLLHGLLRTLVTRLPNNVKLQGDLHELSRQVIAVDGTFFAALADLAWGIKQRRSNGKPGARVGMQIHLDCATNMPLHMELIDGEKSEADLARGHIRPGAIYLYDRGHMSFDLLRDLLAADASFVLRLTTQPRFEATEERLLNPADRDAGVISDRVGRLPGALYKSPPPDAELREVLIHNPDEPDKPVRLLTDLLDLSAAQIGLLYHHRWQVELFFRWLKVYANFDHLMSHGKNGVLLSFYVAVIGTVLMCLRQNRAPNKYDVMLLSMAACGNGTYADLAPIMARRARSCELARISQQKRLARKRAEKQGL